MFDGDHDLDDVRLSQRQEFERYDHKALYKWCQTQLTSSDLFDDLQEMKHGQLTKEWILSIVEGWDSLNGENFLLKDVSSEDIMQKLLTLSKGKHYREKYKTDENKDAFSIHLCVSILSRLRILAFKQETQLGFIPSNNYVIYFWCFFNAAPVADIYIRCCEIVPSLVSFTSEFLFGCFLFVCFFWFF